MRVSAVIIGACLVLSAGILGAMGRYAGGPVSSGAVWKLDRWTGELEICDADKCYLPRAK